MDWYGRIGMDGLVYGWMLVSKLIVILLIFTVGTRVCYIGTDFINYYNYCNASRNILVKLPQTACFRSFS